VGRAANLINVLALQDPLGRAFPSGVDHCAAYLRRPDLGRMLDEESRQALAALEQPAAPLL